MKWIKELWNKITREIRFRKRMKELKKKDPFVYSDSNDENR